MLIAGVTFLRPPIPPTSGPRVWGCRDAPAVFAAIPPTLLLPNNLTAAGSMTLSMPCSPTMLSTTLSHRVPFVGLPRGFTPAAHDLARPAFRNGSRRVLSSKMTTSLWTSKQSTELDCMIDRISNPTILQGLGWLGHQPQASRTSESSSRSTARPRRVVLRHLRSVSE